MYNSFHTGTVQVDNYEDIKFIKICDLEHPERLLEIAIDILRRVSGLRWWISFGTLLGFYRDGGFISDDSDIDISIYVHKPELVEIIINAFSLLFPIVRKVYNNEVVFQCVFKRYDGFLLDLSFFYGDGDKIYSYHETGKWVNDYKLIKDIKLFYPKDIKMFVPVPLIEEYLESRYNNWRIKSNEKSISQ